MSTSADRARLARRPSNSSLRNRHGWGLPSSAVVRLAIGLAAAGSCLGCGERFDEDPGGGGSGPTCTPGSASAFSDDFDDGTIDAARWDVTAGSPLDIQEREGVLAIVHPVAAGGQLGGATSHTVVDLTCAAVSARAVAVPVAGSGVAAVFALFFDTGNLTEVYADEQTIGFVVLEYGQAVEQSSRAWNSSGDRYWRIRESAGTVYIETSPDGVAYTTELDATAPTYLAAAEVGLLSYSLFGPAVTAETQFDDVNH